MSKTRFIFKCPYCFADVADDKVHFRAPYESNGEFQWPDNNYYESAEDFRQRYAGEAQRKKEILQRYEEWTFFAPRDDELYEEFWSGYSGFHTEDGVFNTPVPLRKRRVLNPSNAEHQKYLKPRRKPVKEPDAQTNDEQSPDTPSAEKYLVRDGDGMVAEIQLRSGQRCDQRVCPFCHNPLPNDYGKYRTKFIVVVGGGGSGKTVYLSQLLKNMGENMVKNGMIANVRSAGTVAFLRNHPVKLNQALPTSTPYYRFEQPLYYELVSNVSDAIQQIDTIVLYDVAGQVYMDRYALDMKHYAPFLLYADGVIVLLEPNQFSDLAQLSEEVQEEKEEEEESYWEMQTNDEEGELITPAALLGSIYKVVSSESSPRRKVPTAVAPDTPAKHKKLKKGDKKTEAPEPVQNPATKVKTFRKCDTPIAVCLSKSDMESVKEGLGDELYTLINADMDGIRGNDGFYLPQFNAKQYNPIQEGLAKYFHEHELTLDQSLHTSYTKYAYFAVSALGCAVEKRWDDDEEKPISCPVGSDIHPHRIEEPLLWLLYELGYTTANERIHYLGARRCKYCGSYDTEKHTPPEKNWFMRMIAWIVEHIFRIRKPTPNFICKKCGYAWHED